MSGEQFNIDRPLMCNLKPLLPKWVVDQIDQSEATTIEDIFPSLAASNTGGYAPIARNGQRRHSLYPITAFCLVQLRVGSTDRRWFPLRELIDQHKQFEIGHTKDPDKTTYEKTIKRLVEAGLLERVKDGKTTKYGLASNQDVAPAFDRTHPYNIRDRITMDDPTATDDTEAMLGPLPNTADRPAVIPAQIRGGRLSNPWDAGVSFVVLGVALTVLCTGLAASTSGFLTRPVVSVLWAVLSVGIAAMLVEILDQLKAGYQYSE